MCTMAERLPERFLVKVGDRDIELSNLDKVLYPQAGFTKGEVIDYYTRIAPVLMPHLVDRSLTRIRYPNGVAEQGFFEKNKPAGTPRWVRTERLPAHRSSGGRTEVDYIVVEELATLVWLANLAALELHTHQWKVTKRHQVQNPDLLVVDLDPGPPAGLAQCCEAALLLRDRLAADGLDAYPKTSGKKGMQLCCPVSGTQTSDEVSGYAKRIAEELERKHPKLVLSRMAKPLRRNKVFIDWSQNSAAKTTVTPYSLRAQPVPSVSTPLTWEEVEEGGFTAEDFTAPVVLERVEELGDLLAPLGKKGPKVPGAK
jgi:bifunctional non-homologous end joining protein LigD